MKMDRLRGLFEDLGFQDVSTFVASGNVLFSSDSSDSGSMRTGIEAHMARELGYEVPTFIRNPGELAMITSGDAPEGSDSGSHHVIFLHAPPPDSLRDDLVRLTSEVDSFEVSGREIHWRIRGRMSESPLFGGELDRALRGIPNTSRNMNTLRRIVARVAAA